MRFALEARLPVALAMTVHPRSAADRESGMVAPELPLTPPRPEAMLGPADFLRVDLALDAKTETMAS